LILGNQQLECPLVAALGTLDQLLVDLTVTHAGTTSLDKVGAIKMRDLRRARRRSIPSDARIRNALTAR